MTTDRRAQRDEFAALHRAAFDGLLAATADLDDDGWRAATGCPGWDVHDQLAHCVGFERRFLGDPERDPDVEVPDLPHLRDDVARHVERDVEARRGMPHDELRAEALETFERRAAALAALDPAALEEEVDGPFGRGRRTGLLRTRLFDLAAHERDVRGAVDRLAGWEGPHVALAVEQTLRTWARLLPARMEGAGTVRLTVDGRAVDLDLGAGTLEPGDAEAAATEAGLVLSAADLLAVASGRHDAPDLDQLAWSGDEHLLRRLLAVATITP